MDATHSSGSNCNNSSSKLFCTTCKISSTSLENQRKHAQTDWHVYNLKRRIATLAPLSLQVFNEKIHSAQQAPNSESPHASTCQECQESFQSVKPRNKHCNRQNHVRTAKRSLSKQARWLDSDVKEIGTDHDVESSDSGHDATETDTCFDPSECLFCRLQSSSLSLNVQHMQVGHSFFIPNQECVTDMETFLSYLYIIITVFNECLYCGSAKNTAEATKSHMIDRGHCMLNFDLEGELKMFWERESDDEEVVFGSQLAKTPLAGAQDTTSNSELGISLSTSELMAHRFQPNPSRQQRPTPNVPRQAITNNSVSCGMTQDPRTGRQIITRAHGGSGLIGISQLQRRTLMAVEMASKKIQTKAQNKYARNLERSTNKTGQKHYKHVGNPIRVATWINV